MISVGMQRAIVMCLLISVFSCIERAHATSSALGSICTVVGAVPNDGLDDRAAIQAALSSQGCAYLPSGRYDIDTPVVVAPARRPYMMLDATGAQLYGDGPSTVLHFRGDAGAADWQGVRLAGTGAAIRDITLDTSDLTNTNEQTHALHTLGPAQHLEVARVNFRHPVRGTEAGGDCYQIVGYNDGRIVDDVYVHDSDFACDRSGVGIHSGTINLVIEDNRFSDVGNTDIDFEGSGDTSLVTIRHNLMSLSPGIHGVDAIQLQLVTQARITDNVLDGRGIDVYQSDDIRIDHNAVTLTQSTGYAVVSVSKDSSRVAIDHNELTRAASSGPAAVISAMPHNSGTPDHLTISDNVLVQGTASNVVNTMGIVGLYVLHNVFTYAGTTANTYYGVQALGSSGTYAIRTTDIHVERNVFSGALLGAVGTSGSYAGAGTLDSVDNYMTGSVVPKYGLVCSNVTTAGGVLGPLTSTRDHWSPLSCSAGVVVTP